MDLQLKDHNILVSGGAKGIGLAVAQVLAREQANPIILGRNEEDNRKAVASIVAKGGRADYITVELSQSESCEQGVTEAIRRHRTIHGLVNNAGVNDGVSLSRGTAEQFVASLQKNLIHYFELARYSLSELKKNQGAIVNIGSKVAETGQGGTSAYAAANGGRNALTREWAVELAADQVRVNAVIVAECWTPMYASWLARQPDPIAARREIESRIPLAGRMTCGEEIANMVAFLLSRCSSHTTGQLIHVDGGYVHLDRAYRPLA